MTILTTHFRKLCTLCILILGGFTSNAQYCTTGLYYYGCNYSDYIRSVSTTGGTTNISNLNTTCSGAASGYGIFNSQILTTTQGASIGYTIVNNPSWGEYYKIWVDFNCDGDFVDAGEQVYAGSLASNGTAVGSFTVPVTANSGNSRMRVRCVYGGSSSMTPCGYYYGGECEDYPVVIASAAYNNASVAAVLNPTTAPFCSGTYPVQVQVKNKGKNRINNVQVHWTLDGVAQPYVSYNTLIDTQGSVAGNNATVTLGNVTYSNTARTIKAFTSLPNSVADTVNNDDTLVFSRRSSPLALITTTGQTVYCGGGAVNTLLNATGGTSYNFQWRLNGVNIPGATSATYTATSAGDYTLRVDSGGCFNISPILRIDNLAMPQPTISPETYAVYCDGDSLTLNANAGISGATYQWLLQGINIPGATNASYVAKMPGNYVVKTTKFNCTVSSPGTNVSQVPAPTPTITKNVNILSTGGNYVSYQWYVDGVILPDETFSTCIAKVAGTYTVKVSNGGCNATAAGVDVTASEASTSVSNVMYAKAVKIYPNPVTTSVHISAPIATKVTISSVEGKKLVESETGDIDMSNFANGVYIIRVNDSEGNMLKVDKLIKK